MKRFYVFVFLSLSLWGQAQVVFPESKYRTKDNPHYWKNRPPFPGYWQQDVHYHIKANIDEKTDIITASMELTYWNNSPDELGFVFFHLYQNAFTPGSYYEDLQNNNGVFPKYGHYEAQKLGTVVSKMQSGGKELKTELDNTILKVFLDQPLKSGESITFSIDFKTYFQNNTPMRRRMKMFYSYGNNKHYDGVHWYPRIAVYDRKMGWDTDQHLEKEFYGDFGTYDVELTFANNMIVEATGTLLNRKEVLPDDLRAKLDIKNFKDKPFNSAPSVIIPYDSTVRKTWYYHAENVHDFAWTADPTYRIGEAWWNGVQVVALAQEGVASRWQNAASYTAKVIQVYSEDFGMYAYPKMVVADARDGMEYPMLTLDGGYDPDYRDLLAHEVGHNWFYGMVGTNETYRALLDEGFTQFLTCWAYEKIDGKARVRNLPKNKYVVAHMDTDYVRNSEVYNGYMFDAIQGDETVLNTHSAAFNGALRHGGGYRQVYMKTAVMLYNLQYVLGDELFLKAMQYYVEKWKMCHPYVEDWKAAMIEYTKVDLNWFFDQWIDTYKTIDYKVDGYKKGDTPGEYVIGFERLGRMQMPIDFIVIDKNDSVHKFHIPNGWFVKKTDAVVLPRWIGWDKVQIGYQATVKIPAGIKEVIIDPTHRLADVNMLNNSLKVPIDYRFDSKIWNMPSWKEYRLQYAPDFWYNGYDGIKLGLNLNGGFANYKNIFDASVWFNSGLVQSNLDTGKRINKFDDISFSMQYRTPTDKFSKNSSVNFDVRLLDGLNLYQAGLDKKSRSGKDRIYVSFKSMIRKDSTDLYYLLYPSGWQVNQLNNTLTLGLEHKYNYSYGNGIIDLSLRSSTLMSSYDYSAIALSVVNRNNLGKKLKFNTRFFMQYGTGKYWPSESQLYLAGASPEELMDNKFTRSQGFFPMEWVGYGASTNHFHAGGGLNLRGYAGYLAPEGLPDGNIRFAYKGVSGASFNAELEFEQLFKRKRYSKFAYRHYGFLKFSYWLKTTFKLNMYLFGDIGLINYNNYYEDLTLSEFRADAGLGTALTIRRWGPLQTVNPLTIRFDMPLFLNRIPATDNGEFVKFRWIIGISRAF
ncbi:MAG: M1 family metallopeptidase [Bacteroidota bacterium]